MLTLNQLKNMRPETIFANGAAPDNQYGINMSNSGIELKWLAIRGGIHDWAIYCHTSDKDLSWIKRHGDKVHSDHHIKQLVECDKESFKMYRH